MAGYSRHEKMPSGGLYGSASWSCPLHPEARSGRYWDGTPAAAWAPASYARLRVASETERGSVKCDLIVAADLVCDLLPGIRDRVRTLLRSHLTRKNLGELVLRDAVILENAGNTRLDRSIRVIVG